MACIGGAWPGVWAGGRLRQAGPSPPGYMRLCQRTEKCARSLYGKLRNPLTHLPFGDQPTFGGPKIVGGSADQPTRWGREVSFLGAIRSRSIGLGGDALCKSTQSRQEGGAPPCKMRGGRFGSARLEATRGEFLPFCLGCAGSISEHQIVEVGLPGPDPPHSVFLSLGLGGAGSISAAPDRGELVTWPVHINRVL